ncbi:MAG: c-type cytochrome [Reyranella sp.]|nr:c-type cytochrome [Reyranella sp.]
MRRFVAGLTAFLFALPLAVRAQDSLKRGADIAANGVGDAVPACSGCHMQNGIADGSGAFPRLAGQSAWYMSRQFADYASGARTSALMGPIAKALSAADGAAVAAYYANAEGPFVFNKRADAMLVERGRQLARTGDQAKQLPACNNCHGPGGIGEFPAIPYLAGQYADYVALQLQMWKSGARKDSAEGMADIAKRLSEQDMAAVAAYYQQLREASAQAAK